MERPTRRTVGLMTVGCKLNQYETEGIAELLESAGYEVVPFEERADVYVVNTCTVTARSDYRCRQMLRRAARRAPDALVVAAGCYAQRDAQTLADMPEVALVVGQSSKSRLPELIGRAVDGRERHASGALVHVLPHAQGRFSAFDIDRFRGYTRAFLKIQDGCDRGCAYCAVPAARGPARSRALGDVVEQARKLVDNGYRELVLTGVHIGAYGQESGGPGLHVLLEELLDIEGLARVRLGSVEPTEITSELADAIAASGRVARHLHVPLQSGSDRVLRTMRRGYTSAGYADALRLATRRVPRIGVGADVIVGFPGETESDFDHTVKLIEELPITYLHVFSYSPRPGTEAARMTDDVPGTEKKRRSRVLRALGRRKSLEFRRSLVGTVQEVLIEERSDRNGRPLSGLASNYVRVEVEGGEGLRNTLVRVEVEGADESRTWGNVLGERATAHGQEPTGANGRGRTDGNGQGREDANGRGRTG